MLFPKLAAPAVLCATLMSAHVVAAAESDFKTESRKALSGLAEKYSKPKDDYPSIRDCKKRVVALLESADTEQKRLELSQLVAEAFAKTDQFQFYEYYFLWKGGQFYDTLDPDHLKMFVTALITKVQNATKMDIDWEVRNEWCGFAIEYIDRFVRHPFRLTLDEKTGTVASGKQFADWFAANEKRLKHDAKNHQLFLPD